MTSLTPSLGKTEAGQMLDGERIRRDITWARIAEEIAGLRCGRSRRYWVSIPSHCRQHRP